MPRRKRRRADEDVKRMTRGKLLVIKQVSGLTQLSLSNSIFFGGAFFNVLNTDFVLYKERFQLLRYSLSWPSVLYHPCIKSSTCVVCSSMVILHIDTCKTGHLACTQDF